MYQRRERDEMVIHVYYLLRDKYSNMRYDLILKKVPRNKVKQHKALMTQVREIINDIADYHKNIFQNQPFYKQSHEDFKKLM